MSRANLSTDQFGRSGWIYIHLAAKSSTVKKNFKNFIMSLKTVLPCSSCREHFTELLDKTWDDSLVDNKEELQKYLWGLHNSVSNRIGKPTITFEEYMKINFKLNWLFLHSVTFAYSPEDKNVTKLFFESVSDMLVPELSKLKESDYDSTESLIKAVFDIHNNSSNWKYSWDTFIKYYREFIV